MLLSKYARSSNVLLILKLGISSFYYLTNLWKERMTSKVFLVICNRMLSAGSLVIFPFPQRLWRLRRQVTPVPPPPNSLTRVLTTCRKRSVKGPDAVISLSPIYLQPIQCEVKNLLASRQGWDTCTGRSHGDSGLGRGPLPSAPGRDATFHPPVPEVKWGTFPSAPGLWGMLRWWEVSEVGKIGDCDHLACLDVELEVGVDCRAPFGVGMPRWKAYFSWTPSPTPRKAQWL